MKLNQARKKISIFRLKLNFMKSLLIIFFLLLIQFGFSQKYKKSPTPKSFQCTTFVYNLTNHAMKIKDICVNVQKGEYLNLNAYSSTQRKENECWKFKIFIKDNQTLSSNNYEASFYIYENSDEITQYHPVVENDEFKAIIYDKLRSCWQILLYQNDEYKILSCYSGYHYTNAFGIKEKKKSSIDY